VATELQSIRDRLGGRVLADDNYTKANLQAALSDGDYNIVHMATHGTVSAATADSFLLTYDGRLTMTDLETALRRDSREPRIDLLTLSGCETAVGDERAALGLAGMAVKSGAASVLASLWKVDDAATARLMDRFYEQLQTGQAAKARALRSAQLSMLADVRFSHPAHWAAFMLIGSWQ
jgi:CHAT domain-containing protein